MGKSTKKQPPTTPANISHSQGDLTRFLDKKSKQANTSEESKMADAMRRSPSPAGSTASGYSTTSLPQDLRSLFANLPTKADLNAVAQTIQEAHKADIADLRKDLQAIGDAQAQLEVRLEKAETVCNTVFDRVNDHHRYLYLIKKQMEELDNRGRRNNLRIRGIPESVTQAELRTTVCAIFNTILGKAITEPLELDRDVAIFPDLAWLTLQQRRALKPLTTTLREKEIAYRWTFPFALIASKNNRQFSLKEPAELESFCKALDLPDIKLNDWTDLAYNGDLLDQLCTDYWIPAHQRASRGHRSHTATPRSNME
ncbi:hypothetical protein XELAEV_18024719mg [Xenopus laevis]|uniref:Uncharacterized protein n=1 Tax=Xenopus laevis TaxID=8355 RepID=A0A974D0K2_XENLA|nr:hypothetical protein XELAEV_18024719mg [Xenopus laevis]